MYCGKNFENKEDLEKAIKRGVKVTVYTPRWVKKALKRKDPVNGMVAVMGQHIRLRDLRDATDIKPECKQHSWWADVRIEDGIIKEIF